MEVKIYRYNPDLDTKPYFQTYLVDTNEVEGIMLLDLIEHIKTKDPSLGIRRSCGGGVCGSDGMNINGKNGLACQTPWADLSNKVVLRPLPGMPVVRDLIVNMERFYKHYEAIKPHIHHEGEAPEKEYLQSKEDRSALDGLYECILCACCTTSCPSYWWNPDKFLGPAALLWACRFIADSRDEAFEARLEQLESLYALYRCRGIMNCVDVCPKGLSPTKAIGDIRSKISNEF
jgi:succinate dehydrogenase / fumarate reductase iron-sulfur subunit